MIYSIQRFRLFVDQTLNAKYLASCQVTSDDLDAWVNLIQKERHTLETFLDNRNRHPAAGSKNGILLLSRQLIEVSNMVYGNQIEYAKIRARQPEQSKVNVHYIKTGEIIEEMLIMLSNQYPGKIKVPMTNFARMGLRTEMRMLRKELQDFLNKWQIDNTLGNIFMNGITQIMQKPLLLRSELNYLKDLIYVILSRKNIDTQQLAGILIIMDFNLPELFLYFVNIWRSNLDDEPDMHEQLNFLIRERKKLAELKIQFRQLFDQGRTGLFKELKTFLLETQAILTEQLTLRNETAPASRQIRAVARFLTGLPVPQFGLFIKLLVEKGVLPKDRIGELFKFFATHFYTNNAHQISPESLQKKSTDVEFTTALKLKGVLISMINWLNSNYKLSNFN